MKISEKVDEWLQPPFDESTQAAVQALMKNQSELEEAFYQDLSFGTGGMRGVMGVGTNRINAYTLGKNTQGICHYLKEKYLDEKVNDSSMTPKEFKDWQWKNDLDMRKKGLKNILF